jgi:hypothetical protein
MNEDDCDQWENVAKDLGIPPDLQAEIEDRAQQAGLSPCEYLVAVVWRDRDKAHDQSIPAGGAREPSHRNAEP